MNNKNDLITLDRIMKVRYRYEKRGVRPPSTLRLSKKRWYKFNRMLRKLMLDYYGNPVFKGPIMSKTFAVLGITFTYEQ